MCRIIYGIAGGATELGCVSAAAPQGEYDAVVIGLGGMGSAALAHLAKRRKRVLGIEQFARGHDLGSSTGRSRIIRMAYFEDPAYVPLLRRAYALWRELERESETQLLDLYGVLIVGAADGRVFERARESARGYGIPLEELERADLLRRFPSLHVKADERGLLEPQAGSVFPEAAVAAHTRVAERHGAELRYQTRVIDVHAGARSLRLTLDDGSALRTDRLAICAGPWLAELTRELALPLRVQRNVQVWFTPSTPAYSRDRFPAFFIERAGWPAPLYGFPDSGDGVKAAFHGYGETTSPADLARDISASDVAPVKAALDAWMPGAAAIYLSGKACMYTLTPDEHFIIDTHPNEPRIVIAGGFSGHGYKFCPVVGEIAADLLTEGITSHPIDFLRLRRLRTQSAPF